MLVRTGQIAHKRTNYQRQAGAMLPMDYFYLKIGTGNSEAIDWLEGRNPLKSPAAVIYFDNFTKADYDNGQGKSQPRSFCERASTPNHRDQTRMVVVCHGEVWILKPAGNVIFLPEIQKERWQLTPKAMPVEVLARKPMKDVPPVLASIGVNQYYARGTFRPINHWGNFKAIDCTLGAPFKGEHWDVTMQGPSQMLECLGPLEFETLVAKLLEAKGCFVPAYRGGLIQDIDLYAHNDNAKDLNLGGLSIAAGRSVSIQVKTWSNGTKKSDSVDYLIGFDVEKFDSQWVLERTIECPSVALWVKRSLDWLPETLLSKFGLS